MADEEPKNDETPVEETADETADAVTVDAAPETEAAPEAAAETEAAPEAAASDAAPEAEAEAPAEKPKRASRAKAAPKAEAAAEDEAPKRRGPRAKPMKVGTKPEKKERGVYRRDPKVITVQGSRKERRGIVVSAKPDKTIIIRVDSAKPHPKYLKIVRRSVRLHAHDERNEAGLGDTVRIIETRPLSKLKRWRLAEILERAK
jgi:small subunit ribosomal protein S17